jgi:hypothetical protein
MCLVVAIAAGDAAIIATDRRHGAPHRVTGEILTDDLGGKLRPVPGGWIAATGHALIGFPGLAAVAGIGLADASAAANLLAQTHARYTPRLGRTEFSREQAGNTRWLAIRGAPGEGVGAHLFTAQGEQEGGGAGSYYVTCPPGLSQEEGEQISTDFIDSLRDDFSVPNIIRRVAALFAHVATLSPYVGTDIEVGALRMEAGGGAHYMLRGNDVWGRVDPAQWSAPVEDYLCALAADLAGLHMAEGSN